jgi:replicative DNA helicase Mcm
MEEGAATRLFGEFFNEYCNQQVMDLAQAYPDRRSLNMDFSLLSKFNSELADALMDRPDTYLKAAEAAARQLEAITVGEKEFAPHVRIVGVPDELSVTVQNLGAEYLNKVVRVDGIVTLITQIMPKLQTARWVCIHCTRSIDTAVGKTGVEKPSACPGCGRGDGLYLSEQASGFVNMQRSQVQDPVEKIKGNIPAPQVDLWLEDDLVNTLSPGDNVIVTGVLRLRQNQQARGGKATPVYSKFFDVVGVEKMQKEFEELSVTKEEEEQILELSRDPHLQDKVIMSIAPSIYGYSEMKEAIAVQLFGGTQNKVLPDGKKIRGDIHVLLVGDPGCLVFDERVVLGDGSILQIGELGSRHLEDISVQVLTGQGKARDTATVFHKYEQQPVIEIVTESGKSIKGTRNHPLLCVSKESGTPTRSWKRLDEFRVGDRVAVTTGIPCTITGFIPTGFAPQGRANGPKFRGKLPAKVTPELAAFVGYALGDGWVQKYRVGFVVAQPEFDVLDKLCGFSESLFGIRPKVTKRMLAGRTVQLHYANIGSEDVACNLAFLAKKRVPSLIMRSGNAVVSEFLKWLFEADGTVFSRGRGRRAVALKAKDVELLRDVQVLLLRFGIHSRIVENALCIRRGADIIKFEKKIGFASAKKKAKLSELAKQAKAFQRFNSQRSEKIVKIRYLEPQTVYDIEVPTAKRFIANGIISHNTAKSTILQYVKDLAPKGIYVSGKGASGVGLTASAEKDEVADGGWVLKAGALVLASGGVVMVDEFDKMEPNDRASMHEAMEQQTISVAKAGIVTTFKSKTSILAAANPKLGRFDPNTPPAQQFDIPPTLMSRFDLIFAIKDVLDEARDRKLVDHVLTGHMFAAKKQKASDLKDSPIFPPIEPGLLRKYISYSRKNIHPVLSEEAANRIKEYYLSLRRMGAQQNTYPVTAREIEGLIRMSEASAKLRLSQTVELRDAERAISLVHFVLSDIFMDKETGRIDSDIISTGQPKSKVDRMRSVLGIINALEQKLDMVDIDEIVEQAQSIGMDESTARRLIDELKRNGDLYEPKVGFVKSSRTR